MDTKNISGLLFVLFFLLAGCAQQGVLEVDVAPATTNIPLEGGLPAELKPLVEVLVHGDGKARASVAQLLKAACTTNQGLGGPPRCEAGQQPGELVTVFPLGGPEGHFVKPEALADALDFKVKALFAVYRAPTLAVTDPWWPVGEYALLLEGFPAPDGAIQAVVALVRDGRLVRVDFPAGQNPGDIFATVPLADVILPPSQEQMKAIPPRPTPTLPPFSLNMRDYAAPIEWPRYDGDGYSLAVDPRWAISSENAQVQFVAPESPAFAVTLGIQRDQRSLAQLQAATWAAGTQMSRVEVDGREGLAFLGVSGRLDVFVTDGDAVLHLFSDEGLSNVILTAISSLQFR